ncbi:N-acetyltransferase [Ammoniphilus sp. CFH 90114]|uniref:N-acetyltransferase n=1 Tax=Ammoniphilus sp. CFH 90114 TaxID=2493665 RepID=UPI00100EB8E4|nr:N-acetyltransferase [Ammoniphilus sp. CFH 90114]RXT06277.1 N-acetyltransferase [Ammoniphilus sp. CFH 90114]
MYSFISQVEDVLEQHHIHYSEQLEADHVTILTDQLMSDPGFSLDNKVLDLFIDEDNKILFIGLLRIPRENRRKNIGREIVKHIACWAEQNGYTLFLDSCGDSCYFWSKCGFTLIERRFDFDIMGFGTDRTYLKDRWKYGQLIFAETH